MPLLISCLSDDPARIRAMIDRLHAAGWPTRSITLLHPDSALAEAPAAETGAEAAAVAGGSGAALAGAFGWLVGYGVLAVPAAVVGGALAGIAGATLGAGVGDEAALRRSVWNARIDQLRGTTAALVVQADDARSYDRVVEIFRCEGGRDVQVAGKGRLESGAAP